MKVQCELFWSFFGSNEEDDEGMREVEPETIPFSD